MKARIIATLLELLVISTFAFLFNLLGWDWYVPFILYLGMYLLSFIGFVVIKLWGIHIYKKNKGWFTKAQQEEMNGSFKK